MCASSHDTERPRLLDDALLGRLGLDGSASDDQVEAAHDDIAAFLSSAPSSLRGWARARLREADEAYVVLRGNGQAEASYLAADDLAPSAERASEHSGLPAAKAAVRPSPRRRDRQVGAAGERRNGNQARATMLGDALGGGDWYEPDPEPRRRTEPARRARVRRPEVMPQAPRGGLRRVLLAGGIVVALGAVAVIGFKLGDPTVPGLTGTPAPPASGPVVDQAQVAALMTRIAADPEDVAALEGLANLYFAVNDFATASIWLDKLLAVEPENVPALLGAGAAAYNLGQLDKAEDVWLKVVELEPDNVEVHYDLGLLYLAQEPPDLTRVEQEWRKVIELDPDSDIAETVAAHLEGLVPAASGSPAASGAPAGSPDATPASSAEPTAEASSEPAPAGTEGD